MSKEKKAKPSYYAVIPASIRYDERLKAAEKLLYGEITCLTNQKGFCWSTNKYLAELYNTSEITISRWVKSLIKLGYIKSEITKTKTGSIRKIYLSDPLIKNDDTPSATYQKSKKPLIKNDDTPLIKNDKHNNTSNINNTSKNKREEKEISPVSKIDEESNPLKDHKENNKTSPPITRTPPPPDFSKYIEIFIEHYRKDGENMGAILPRIQQLISNRQFNANEWPKIAAHIPEYFERTVKHNTKGTGEWRRKAYNYITNKEWITNPNPEKIDPTRMPARKKTVKVCPPRKSRFEQFQNVG